MHFETKKLSMKLIPMKFIFILLFVLFFIEGNAQRVKKPPLVVPETIDIPFFEDYFEPVLLKPIKTTIIPEPICKTTAKINLRVNDLKDPKVAYVIVSHWKSKNTLGFDLNEVALVNWSAGGISSIAGLLSGKFTRIRTLETSEWVNELIFRYGINKQDGLEIRKSDDEFRFNSTFGYRKDNSTFWYHTVKFNFNTQFTAGYKYPNTTNPISKFLAPAYTFLGVGADYFDKKNNFDVFISPLTMKNTLVLDQTLANNGAFGVVKAVYDTAGNIITEGQNSKTEVGFLVTNQYKKEIFKNITMENRLSLYSDYINYFGNVDIDWTLNFNLIVNQFVKANIGTQIIYDDDIKTSEEINGTKVVRGAKIQLRQTLGVGMVYNF